MDSFITEETEQALVDVLIKVCEDAGNAVSAPDPDKDLVAYTAGMIGIFVPAYVDLISAIGVDVEAVMERDESLKARADALELL